MRTINDDIRRGEKPQGYELTEADVGKSLALGWGEVMEIDIGKRCYVKSWGFAMENDAQRDCRSRGAA